MNAKEMPFDQLLDKILNEDMDDDIGPGEINSYKVAKAAELMQDRFNLLDKDEDSPAEQPRVPQELSVRRREDMKRALEKHKADTDTAQKKIEAILYGHEAGKQADEAAAKAAGVGRKPGGAVTGTAIGGAIGPSVKEEYVGPAERREELIKRAVADYFDDIYK